MSSGTSPAASRGSRTSSLSADSGKQQVRRCLCLLNQTHNALQGIRYRLQRCVYAYRIPYTELVFFVSPNLKDDSCARRHVLLTGCRCWELRLPKSSLCLIVKLQVGHLSSKPVLFVTIPRCYIHIFRPTFPNPVQSSSLAFRSVCSAFLSE